MNRNQRIVLILSIVFFIVMNLLINGDRIGVQRLVNISDATGILDLEYGYSVDKAYDMLEQMGSSGRDFYLNTIMVLDFIFPVSYVLMLVMMNRILLKRKSLRWLILIPLLTGTMDYLENMLIINILKTYPTRLNGTVQFASIVTIIKNSLFLISIMITVVLFIRWLYRKLKTGSDL